MGNTKKVQKLPWLLPIIVSLVLVLLAIVFLFRLNGGNVSFFKKVSVNYITPVGTIYGEKVPVGTIVELAEAPEIAGYTFISWQKADGKEETEDCITVYDETWYSAVYSVALQDDHSPYLTLDENGFAHPDRIVSRGELADIIASFLAVDVGITDTFADISEDNIFYSSASKLKSLRAVSGSKFYPNEAATLLDALEVLSAFYPQLMGDCSFASPVKDSAEYEICVNAALHGWIDSGDDVFVDINGDLTRKDVAVLINRVFCRSVNEEIKSELIGIIPDADPESDGYFDIVEAFVPHEAEMKDGIEHWRNVPDFKRLDPGMMLVGLDLYYVRENGAILTNGEINGFMFDSDGHYTSGDAELDRLVRELIETDMPEKADTETILKNVYDHIVSDYTFVSGRRFSADEVIPAAELAKKFLEDRKGNCYYYAAAFCMAARSLGYDAAVYKGNVEGSKDLITHGWCGINIDGEIFITDPELAIYLKTDIFMISPEKSRGMGFAAVGK